MSTLSELQDALDIVGKWPQQEATTHPRIQSSMSIVYLAAKRLANPDYEAAAQAVYAVQGSTNWGDPMKIATEAVNAGLGIGEES